MPRTIIGPWTTVNHYTYFAEISDLRVGDTFPNGDPIVLELLNEVHLDGELSHWEGEIRDGLGTMRVKIWND